MINAVATTIGPLVGRLIAAEKEVPESDLNPIAIEFKEVIWGFGSFAVFALILRYAIWPGLKRSIDGRNQRVADDLAAAEAVTEGARGDVEAYEAERAEARAAAHAIIDAARATLDAERTERIAAANAEIAAKRTAALAEVDAARAAARGDVDAAVASLVGSLAEHAIGQRPSDEVIGRAVSSVTSTGARR